jgi:hypothetical protein
MDGLYRGKGKSEPIQQAQLTRHRLLTVNTNPAGTLFPRDASGYASVDPNSGLIPVASQEGGPHFVLSPQTTDGRPTLGFEFCLLTTGMSLVDGLIAVAAPGGFDVTVWAMIGSTQLSDGSAVPAWSSFSTLTGVGLNELFHSFDVNTCVLRFQIGNIATFGSITIAFAEL